MYNLVKEEVDFDPTKIETLDVCLNLNEKKDSKGLEGYDWSNVGAMPWILEDIEEKIQTALGMDQLTSLFIQNFNSKS